MSFIGICTNAKSELFIHENKLRNGNFKEPNDISVFKYACGRINGQKYGLFNFSRPTRTYGSNANEKNVHLLIKPKQERRALLYLGCNPESIFLHSIKIAFRLQTGSSETVSHRCNIQILLKSADQVWAERVDLPQLLLSDTSDKSFTTTLHRQILMFNSVCS